MWKRMACYSITAARFIKLGSMLITYAAKAQGHQHSMVGAN